MLHAELMLGAMEVVPDVCLCTRTTEHAGSPGILAVAEQRIEPALDHSGSVLSAWGPKTSSWCSRLYDPLVFLRVLSVVRLERCRYLQLSHNS